jgi:hypothetical protein
MPSQSEASANDPNDAMEIDPSAADVGPTDAEVEAWAQQERQRREAWLRGPTQTQKSDWAAREQRRRLAEHSAQSGAPAPSATESRLYLMQRYAREAQLATEGAFSLMFSLSVRDVLDQLVQKGRDWEDEYTHQPVRRRIALGSDARDVASEGERGSRNVGESPGTASQTS